MAKIPGQLEQAQLENVTSDPSNLPDGRVWLNTTSDKPKVAIDGAAKELLTADSTNTVTNKTIVAANNTITTAASGNLAATELNTALAELQTDIDTRATSSALTDHLNDTTDAHDASAISFTPAGAITATDVQAALTEVDSDLTAHMNDGTAAHAASAVSFSPVGTIAATDAQTAIAEVATDAASALSTHEADTTSIHGIADTSLLVTTTGAQALTNKTIDADSNTITNIDNADIKAAAGIALNKLAATTASRALVSDGSGFVSASSVTATTLGYLDATSSVQTQLDAKVAKSTYSAKGSLLAATAASTPADLPVGSDGQVLVADSSQSAGVKWTTANSGSKNYFQYTNFESNSTAGFALFNTTLTSKIPTGSITAGASSITTFNTTNSGALAGTYSLQTSIASGTITAGEGFISDNLTLDAEDKGHVMQISFSYSATTGASLMNFSGTSSNTWAVYVYDNANSAWIQPAGVYNIVQSSGVGRCTATFQTPSNATTIRIAVICVNANSSGAVAMLWDSFFVGPQIQARGAAISDLGANTWTPTGSWVSNTTYTGQWQRDGDHIAGWVQVLTTGAPTSATLTINLPSGVTIDTAKLASTSQNDTLGFGSVRDDSASTAYPATVRYNSTTTLTVMTATSTTNPTLAAVTQVAPMTFANLDTVRIYFRAPIVGWSSNSVVSADTDTRVVAAIYSTPATTSMNSGTTYYLDYGTSVLDTHSAVTGTGSGHVTTSGAGWRFVAPVSGVYAVNAQFLYTSVTGFNGTSERVLMQALVDGSVDSTLARIVPASGDASVFVGGYGLIRMNAGQRLEISLNQDSGGALATAASQSANRISINRLSGPAVITATDTVAARIYLSANQTGVNPNATYVKLNFNTREHDATNSWDTSAYRFNVPVSGRYLISANIAVASTNVLASFYELQLYKNNAAFALLDRDTPAVSTGFGLTGNVVLNLVAGDYIEIYLYGSGNNSASTLTVAGGAISGSSISIARIGN